MMALNPSAQLAELAATALIGVDRAGGIAAGAVLSAAATAATRVKAGMVPVRGGTGAPECPVEALPVCSPNAASILSRLLTEGEWIVVDEWARLAAERGRRVPPGLVPAVLGVCEMRPGLRIAFARSLGQCGTWLAGLNPAWTWAVASGPPADIESRWATGTIAERREWLAAIRRNDPARAAPLVRSTWSDDPADDRRAFVDAFEIGLNLADETFLQTCLADRSKGVREAAVTLLRRLPASQYVKRMTAHAERMLTFEAGKKGLLKKKAGRVGVEPPAEWDEALAAEGLEERPPSGVVKRAWWLRQVLGMVPPSHWSAKFGLAPAELIAAIGGSDFEPDVLAAWVAAAPATGDVDWCGALARHAIERKKGAAIDLLPLWKGLSPQPRESVIGEVIGAAKTVWTVPWEVLGTADHAWSEPFSRRMVAVLNDSLPSKAAEWWAVGTAIDAIRLRIHPSLASEFEGLVDRLFKGEPPPSVSKATDRLRLRAEIHKEFAA